MSEEKIKFRNSCGAFATGITVITSKFNDNISGMTANGFMSVSLEPPLIAVSIGLKQNMHETIMRSNVFGVSILDHNQENISNHFAGKHNPDLQIEFSESNGIPYLTDNHAYFLAKVVSKHKEGDHTIFIGEVLEHGTNDKNTPLLFYKGNYKKINHKQ
ncbi:flavin reductase family protein [Tenacibaculum sp. UWU-22]|uniref:flavin reductase family protein n=1 Tax=Tenacibaculum sp. UWU-22 TaxID=3234187 RepID=UPI0034DAD294